MSKSPNFSQLLLSNIGILKDDEDDILFFEKGKYSTVIDSNIYDYNSHGNFAIDKFKFSPKVLFTRTFGRLERQKMVLLNILPFDEKVKRRIFLNNGFDLYSEDDDISTYKDAKTDS